MRAEGYKPDAERLNKLGLAPSDGAVLTDAHDKNYQRVWSMVRPLCAQALGATDAIVDKIGPMQCIPLVFENSERENKDAAYEAQKAVAEIRAGLRPEPGPNEKIHPVEKMFLFLTSANAQFEADLAKTLGPEEAHRVTFSEEACAWKSHWGGRR